AAAELALCNLMNAAGHYKATHSEIDREALSATIKAAAAHLEAAAIRAQGGVRWRTGNTRKSTARVLTSLQMQWSGALTSLH
ncbi:hypothetical protein, partial [Bosea sp. TAF32]|uniref:hypothetical protein n=1 Tax=Bosea sp. TAF32 TaxID=3237482 RepID=UPI003F90ACEA